MTFRPLAAADLSLVDGWLRRDHVRRWWDPDETTAELAEHFSGAAVEPCEYFLIVLDGEPAGFVQAYLVADYPEWDAVVGVGEGVAGVDLFLADVERTGHGLGTEVLRSFVRDVIFARPGWTACVADPDVANTASLRAFEKAGFRPVRDFVDPGDGRLHRLVRIDAG